MFWCGVIIHLDVFKDFCSAHLHDCTQPVRCDHVFALLGSTYSAWLVRPAEEAQRFCSLRCSDKDTCEGAVVQVEAAVLVLSCQGLVFASGR